jgi:Zn finger protein HypA/HybF involved in hydrogenase expression
MVSVPIFFIFFSFPSHIGPFYFRSSNLEVEMGSQVTAECQCGFHASVAIGGGVLDFTTTCYFPCYCEDCHRMVHGNLLEKEPRCPECKGKKILPYDDSSLRKSLGKKTVAEWNIEQYLGRSLRLTNGKYKCPKCEKFTLHFSDGGLCWD